MKNHRSEHRIDAKEAATATILGHPDVTVPCYVRNISRSGMCITVTDSIPMGRVVKVEWQDHFLVGRIRRETAQEADYLVGLELLYCSKWSDSINSVLT